MNYNNMNYNKMSNNKLMVVIKKMLNDNGYKTTCVELVDDGYSITLNFAKIKSNSLKNLMYKLFRYFYMD